jgi:nucleoside-diphosphate-sugar epimerase
VFGDGQQIRAFTHVRDIADGLVAAMERGMRGTPYNLGNPNNRTSIDALADVVITITGSKSRKDYVDPTTIYGPLYAEASDKYPDSERAFQELGWRPRFGIADVVRDTFEYMRHLDSGLLQQIAGLPIPV